MDLRTFDILTVIGLFCYHRHFAEKLSFVYVLCGKNKSCK